MCVKEYVGYNCGHCSIPTLRRCPLSISNPMFPVCNWPAERAIHQQEFCHPCSRVVWNSRVLAEEEKHRQHHLDNECGCGVIFPGEDVENHGRYREPQFVLHRDEISELENRPIVRVPQGPGGIEGTPSILPVSPVGPMTVGYDYMPAIAPAIAPVAIATTDVTNTYVPDNPMAPFSYNQIPGYTREWEQPGGGAYRFFGSHIEQGTGSLPLSPIATTTGYGHNIDNPTGMKWYPDTTNLGPPSQPFIRPDSNGNYNQSHVPRKGHRAHRNKYKGSKLSEPEPEVRGFKSTDTGTRSSSTGPEKDIHRQNEEFDLKEPVIVTSNVDIST